MTDEQLVERFVVNGDRRSLEEVVRRYSSKLRRLLYSLLGADLDRVQDAEQEIFVALIERAAKFRGDSRFSTFFYALARNRVLDMLRSERRRTWRTVEYESPDVYEGRGRGPAEAVERDEAALLLRSALADLPPSDRFLLYMKDAEGESVADLAAITGEREGTIKSRLSRARTKLRRRLEELGYE
jgi:RNA polymerase sigma-70 factor (ECF subfamily)